MRAGTVAAARGPAPLPATAFAALLPDVARRLLGDPPRIGADEWRYGSHGSLAVHPARGTWHDFEADAGGGVLALVQHVNGCDKAGALRYLVDARLIDPPAGADARPANRAKPCHNAASPPHPIGPDRAESTTTAPRSLPGSSARRAVRRSRGQGGTWTPPESAAPAGGAPARQGGDAGAHPPCCECGQPTLPAPSGLCVPCELRRLGVRR